MNYGGIGAVIGHEISHGFDDQGSKYNGDGALADWWTPADAKGFEDRINCIRDQYAEYVIVDDIHINSKLTSGEDVADLGGTLLAYIAWKKQTEGQKLPNTDGFTPDQRFYLSFGQIWRTKMRDGALRAQILSNPHSPAEFRAVGATRNSDPWYAAFHVAAGQKYYLPPDQRVKLW